MEQVRLWRGDEPPGDEYFHDFDETFAGPAPYSAYTRHQSKYLINKTTRKNILIFFYFISTIIFSMNIYLFSIISVIVSVFFYIVAFLINKKKCIKYL